LFRLTLFNVVKFKPINPFVPTIKIRFACLKS
jgi:hypothetical protein